MTEPGAVQEAHVLVQNQVRVLPRGLVGMNRQSCNSTVKGVGLLHRLIVFRDKAVNLRVARQETLEVVRGNGQLPGPSNRKLIKACLLGCSPVY